MYEYFSTNLCEPDLLYICKSGNYEFVKHFLCMDVFQRRTDLDIWDLGLYGAYKSKNTKIIKLLIAIITNDVMYVCNNLHQRVPLITALNNLNTDDLYYFNMRFNYIDKD